VRHPVYLSNKEIYWITENTKKTLDQWAEEIRGDH